MSFGTWAFAFGLTLLVELPIVLLLLGRRLGFARTAVAGLVVNAVTHPVLWLVFWWVGPRTGAGWALTLLVGEVVVIAVETALLRRLLRGGDPRLVLAVVALANVASVAVGLLLTMVELGHG